MIHPKERAKGGTRRGAGSLLAVSSLAVAMVAVGGLGLLIKAAPRPAATHHHAARGAPLLVGSGSLADVISNLQSRLRALPTDWRGYAALGQAYVQRARVTADPTFYAKADGALRRSLQLNGLQNLAALTGMAALSSARHDFAAALAWGEKAVAADHHSQDARAVLGDAQVELGLYAEAFASFQLAVDLKPELSTYARVSYAWELQGNVRNAIQAMLLALASAGSASDAAWAANQLGDLHWNSGRPGRAAGWYRHAIARDPTFLPPRAGLARVEAASGHLSRAIRAYRWVVDRYPSPEYLISLGDALSAAGRAEEAEREFATVRAEEQLFRSNGVNMDLEVALFDADHGADLDAGLAAARSEWARRRSIHVADTLAWQLYANGRYGEALDMANQALRLGTRSALFHFHRGMIQKALGRTSAAREDLLGALRINPDFSILWSRVAARELSALGGPP